MDALFRAVRKSPNVLRDQGTSKASKIPEGWGENKEPVIDGVTFYLKYIGSTLIEEKGANQTYGDGTSTKAIQNIITMARTAGTKLKKTALTVTPAGIRTVDMATNQVMFDLSIYRISFCTADNNYNHIFAYIARNTTNETMECHAFLCAKRKIAQAVTLTVSQAFTIAQERWLETRRMRRSLRDKASMEKAAVSGEKSQSHYQNISNGLLGGGIIRSRETGSQEIFSLNSESSPQQEIHNTDFRKNWESFEDCENEDIDDMFSRLAENRIKQFSSFGTDLKEEELDDGVQKYMEGSACFEAFSRTKSSEDLLNLF
ncbi:hypothetical protein BsWGS_12931 [Bradybaena similaris]